MLQKEAIMFYYQGTLQRKKTNKKLQTRAFCSTFLWNFGSLDRVVIIALLDVLEYLDQYKGNPVKGVEHSDPL